MLPQLFDGLFINHQSNILCVLNVFVVLMEIHTLQLNFLFSDWLSKYAECIENVHCTPRTAPRLPKVLLVRDRVRDITSTDPFVSLGKIVNILHV